MFQFFDRRTGSTKAVKPPKAEAAVPTLSESSFQPSF